MLKVRASELVNGISNNQDPNTNSIADITITIRDVNDEAPLFNQDEYLLLVNLLLVNESHICKIFTVSLNSPFPFRPLDVEIHRSTVSTDGFHTKSVIEQQS